MNGILYYRLKQHRARQHLADLTGISFPTLKDMETETQFTRPCSYYMRLAAALGVSVEDLIADYPESLLSPGDHFVRTESSSHPNNSIANYRREKNLNFEQLATLLGLAERECARVVCKTPIANADHVATLAALEGLTPKVFEYRFGGGAAHE